MRGWRISVFFWGIPWLLFLSYPLLALLGRGAASSWQDWSSPAIWQAVRLSLVTTSTAALLVVLLGTPLAYALARGRFGLHRVAELLVDLPMVLPPAVAGVALLLAFGRQSLIGGWLEQAGISPAFTSAAVVMAQMFVAGPFYVRAARAGFASVDRSLEDVSLSLGHSPMETFFRITLPLAAPSLLEGVVMTWARALGEFGATILFAGNFPGVTQTMPLAIYTAMQEDFQRAVWLSIFLLGVSFLLLAIVRFLGGKLYD